MAGPFRPRENAGPTGSAELSAQIVAAHVDAFNSHNTDALLAGLANEVVWITGTDRFTGKAALNGVFDDWLWSLDPMLTVRRLYCSADGAAAQMREDLIVDGARQAFEIAVFFDIADGLVRRATVYREGNAVIAAYDAVDVDDADAPDDAVATVDVLDTGDPEEQFGAM